MDFKNWCSNISDFQELKCNLACFIELVVRDSLSAERLILSPSHSQSLLACEQASNISKEDPEAMISGQREILGILVISIGNEMSFIKDYNKFTQLKGRLKAIKMVVKIT